MNPTEKEKNIPPRNPQEQSSCRDDLWRLKLATLQRDPESLGKIPEDELEQIYSDLDTEEQKNRAQIFALFDQCKTPSQQRQSLHTTVTEALVKPDPQQAVITLLESYSDQNQKDEILLALMLDTRGIAIVFQDPRSFLLHTPNIEDFLRVGIYYHCIVQNQNSANPFMHLVAVLYDESLESVLNQNQYQEMREAIEIASMTNTRNREIFIASYIKHHSPDECFTLFEQISQNEQQNIPLLFPYLENTIISHADKERSKALLVVIFEKYPQILPSKYYSSSGKSIQAICEKAHANDTDFMTEFVEIAEQIQTERNRINTMADLVPDITTVLEAEKPTQYSPSERVDQFTKRQQEEREKIVLQALREKPFTEMEKAVLEGMRRAMVMEPFAFEHAWKNGGYTREEQRNFLYFIASLQNFDLEQGREYTTGVIDTVASQQRPKGNFMLGTLLRQTFPIEYATAKAAEIAYDIAVYNSNFQRDYRLAIEFLSEFEGIATMTNGMQVISAFAPYIPLPPPKDALPIEWQQQADTHQNFVDSYWEVWREYPYREELSVVLQSMVQSRTPRGYLSSDSGLFPLSSPPPYDFLPDHAEISRQVVVGESISSLLQSNPGYHEAIATHRPMAFLKIWWQSETEISDKYEEKFPGTKKRIKLLRSIAIHSLQNSFVPSDLYGAMDVIISPHIIRQNVTDQNRKDAIILDSLQFFHSLNFGHMQMIQEQGDSAFWERNIHIIQDIVSDEAWKQQIREALAIFVINYTPHHIIVRSFFKKVYSGQGNQRDIDLVMEIATISPPLSMIEIDDAQDDVLVSVLQHAASKNPLHFLEHFLPDININRVEDTFMSFFYTLGDNKTITEEDLKKLLSTAEEALVPSIQSMPKEECREEFITHFSLISRSPLLMAAFSNVYPEWLEEKKDEIVSAIHYYDQNDILFLMDRISRPEWLCVAIAIRGFELKGYSEKIRNITKLLVEVPYTYNWLYNNQYNQYLRKIASFIEKNNLQHNPLFLESFSAIPEESKQSFLETCLEEKQTENSLLVFLILQESPDRLIYLAQSGIYEGWEQVIDEAIEKLIDDFTDIPEVLQLFFDKCKQPLPYGNIIFQLVVQRCEEIDPIVTMYVLSLYPPEGQTDLEKTQNKEKTVAIFQRYTTTNPKLICQNFVLIRSFLGETEANAILAEAVSNIDPNLFFSNTDEYMPRAFHKDGKSFGEEVFDIDAIIIFSLYLSDSVLNHIASENPLSEQDMAKILALYSLSQSHELQMIIALACIEVFGLLITEDFADVLIKGWTTTKEKDAHFEAVFEAYMRRKFDKAKEQNDSLEMLKIAEKKDMLDDLYSGEGEKKCLSFFAEQFGTDFIMSHFRIYLSYFSNNHPFIQNTIREKGGEILKMVLGFPEEERKRVFPLVFIENHQLALKYPKEFFAIREKIKERLQDVEQYEKMLYLAIFSCDRKDLPTEKDVLAYAMLFTPDKLDENGRIFVLQNFSDIQEFLGEQRALTVLDNILDREDPRRVLRIYIEFHYSKPSKVLLLRIIQKDPQKAVDCLFLDLYKTIGANVLFPVLLEFNYELCLKRISFSHLDLPFSAGLWILRARAIELGAFSTGQNFGRQQVPYHDASFLQRLATLQEGYHLLDHASYSFEHTLAGGNMMPLGSGGLTGALSQMLPRTDGFKTVTANMIQFLQASGFNIKRKFYPEDVIQIKDGIFTFRPFNRKAKAYRPEEEEQYVLYGAKVGNRTLRGREAIDAVLASFDPQESDPRAHDYFLRELDKESIKDPRVGERLASVTDSELVLDNIVHLCQIIDTNARQIIPIIMNHLVLTANRFPTRMLDSSTVSIYTKPIGEGGFYDEDVLSVTHPSVLDVLETAGKKDPIVFLQSYPHYKHIFGIQNALERVIISNASKSYRALLDPSITEGLGNSLSQVFLRIARDHLPEEERGVLDYEVLAQHEGGNLRGDPAMQFFAKIENVWVEGFVPEIADIPQEVRKLVARYCFLNEIPSEKITEEFIKGVCQKIAQEMQEAENLPLFKDAHVIIFYKNKAAGRLVESIGAQHPAKITYIKPGPTRPEDIMKLIEESDAPPVFLYGGHSAEVLQLNGYGEGENIDTAGNPSNFLSMQQIAESLVKNWKKRGANRNDRTQIPRIMIGGCYSTPSFRDDLARAIGYENTKQKTDMPIPLTILEPEHGQLGYIMQEQSSPLKSFFFETLGLDQTQETATFGRYIRERRTRRRDNYRIKGGYPSYNQNPITGERFELTQQFAIPTEESV
jgi:hypothetical protein